MACFTLCFCPSLLLSDPLLLSATLLLPYLSDSFVLLSLLLLLIISHVQAIGQPTIEESEADRILSEAKNLPGSPFL
jgi:hypothetical protein